MGKTILEYTKLKKLSICIQIFEEGVILYLFY